MSTLEITFLFMVFLAASFGAAWILIQYLPDWIDLRLGQFEPSGSDIQAISKPRLTERLALTIQRWTQQVGALAPQGDRSNEIQRRLTQAGVRSPHAQGLFLASRLGLTVLLSLLAAVGLLGLGQPLHRPGSLFILVLAATIGHYLPNALLTRMMAQRQDRIGKILPDVLDLIRVCMLAGLGLDAAIDRVGRDIGGSSRDMANELSLTVLELRAGVSRPEALRHLADRIGLPDIESLVSLLIQADRFGTSIAESLQLHADNLRTKRRMAAEEAANKLPIKLLFPLVFCVFPALLIVLLGPALVSLRHHFEPQTQTAPLR